MTDRDKPEFLKTVTAMAMMYQRDCPMVVIDLYFQVLRDLEIEQVKAAVVGLLGTSKFMPRAAEIREAIEGPPLVLKTSPAERAWPRLIEMVETLHSCNRVECDDPALARALEVAIGPWNYAVHKLLLDPNLDQIGRAVLRKDFISAYETALAEGVPTSGHCVLRAPKGALLRGNRFMLGLGDRNGVRLQKFDTEAQALAWRDQQALQAAPGRRALPRAPAPAARVAHEDDDREDA
jgi:hypothetical protein